MTLFDAVNTLSTSLLDTQNNWYSWREIDERKLPVGITLPKGNQYFKNIALKNELHQKWKNTTLQEEKDSLIRYYITTWGGIYTNTSASMVEYTTQPAPTLIQKGKKGIASWSKAIVVHDPQNYAIFDARVSVSLNCLQILHGVESKELYPLLPSRNKVVAKANKLLKAQSKKERWKNADEMTFYNNYLQLLKEVTAACKADLSTVEMLLFAKAEELAKKAFPSEC